MKIDELMADIDQRYLDIDKINQLSDIKAKAVMDLYQRLMTAIRDKMTTINGMPNTGVYLAINSMSNTLVQNGYLVTKREQNLNKVLD